MTEENEKPETGIGSGASSGSTERAATWNLWYSETVNLFVVEGFFSTHDIATNILANYSDDLREMFDTGHSPQQVVNAWPVM